MSRVKSFFFGWIITTLAVLVATKIVKGIDYSSPVDLMIATLLLGFLNAFVRPIMMFLTFPLMIVTLGLFSLVINALLLLAVSALLGDNHFHVQGFGAAFWGGLVISLTTLVLNSLTGTGRSRVRFQRPSEPPPPPRRSNDDGPVIDV
ncbi:MAG: phage holin family protein [Limisphaerales bacterium]